jgi:hypothetical protein
MRHSPIRRVRWWGGWADVADYTLYQNLWPGNGDGTFAPLVVVAQVEYQQSPIPREDFKNLGGDGDFNRDGLEDYAQLTTEIGRRFRHIGPVIIGLNLGGGAFEERLFDIGTGEYGLITGDFDGDGWSDLALLRNNTLTVLINDHVW